MYTRVNPSFTNKVGQNYIGTFRDVHEFESSLNACHKHISHVVGQIFALLVYVYLSAKHLVTGNIPGLLIGFQK